MFPYALISPRKISVNITLIVPQILPFLKKWKASRVALCRADSVASEYNYLTFSRSSSQTDSWVLFFLNFLQQCLDIPCRKAESPEWWGKLTVMILGCFSFTVEEVGCLYELLLKLASNKTHFTMAFIHTSITVLTLQNRALLCSLTFSLLLASVFSINGPCVLSCHTESLPSFFLNEGFTDFIG